MRPTSASRLCPKDVRSAFSRQQRLCPLLASWRGPVAANTAICDGVVVVGVVVVVLPSLPIAVKISEVVGGTKIWVTAQAARYRERPRERESLDENYRKTRPLLCRLCGSGVPGLRAER